MSGKMRNESPDDSRVRIHMYVCIGSRVNSGRDDRRLECDACASKRYSALQALRRFLLRFDETRVTVGGTVRSDGRLFRRLRVN